MGQDHEEPKAKGPQDTPFDPQEDLEKYVGHFRKDHVPHKDVLDPEMAHSGKGTREERKIAKDRALMANAQHLYNDLNQLDRLLGEALSGTDEINDKAHTAARALKLEIYGLNKQVAGSLESPKDAEIYLKKCKKILYKHQSDIMSAPETWNQIKSRFAAFMNRYFNAGMSPKVKQSGFISQKQELKTTFFKAKGYGEKIPKDKTPKTSKELSEESENTSGIERQQPKQ